MRLRLIAPALLLAALGSLTSATLLADSGLTAASPFLPGPGQAVIGAGPSENLEFAGVSIVDRQTMISLYDVAARRGRWIPVGTKVDGTEVVSYDAQRDQVVLRVYGQLKQLSLRKGSKPSLTSAVANGVAAATGPVAFGGNVMPAGGFAGGAAQAAADQPAAQVAANRPTTVEGRQEEEARMFVSDMLEIGMQHRKAYEQAQASAALGSTSGVATGTAYTPTLAPAAPSPSPGS